jgi:hypothetical protein
LNEYFTFFGKKLVELQSTFLYQNEYEFYKKR